jgi:hypothetical protein
MAAFPPQNYDKYRWTSPRLDKTKFQRYAAGSELFTDLERRNNHGQYSMFLGIEVSLASAEGPNHVLRLARHAWMTLRHSIPTMAAWTELDAAGDTLIVYRVASGPDEVHSWAERTVQLVTHSVDDVRNQLLDHLIPADSHDQTLLHIIPNTTSSREYTLIFSVNHTLFDSTGHKALTHHFLSALARYVGTKGQAEKEVSALKWGEEGANLLPPCTDILAETEPIHGPGYDQTLGGILQDVASTSPVSLVMFDDDFSMNSKFLFSALINIYVALPKADPSHPGACSISLPWIRRLGSYSMLSLRGSLSTIWVCAVS